MKKKRTRITHAKEDVLVIGAGPAGIATAYALEQAGISYKVVDREQMIGSTWDKLYPSLRLNTSRFFSHMPGMPFPAEYGIFATGRQYHTHLLDFVDKHQFNIHTGIQVERVVPEAGLWRVETSENTQLYRAVISATGVYNNPVMPDIPGLLDFRGELMHSHDFRHPAQMTGKRLLVVGSGPSGVDTAIASTKYAKSVHLTIRSGIKIIKRFPGFLPKHAWMMLAEFLPDDVCAELMQTVGGWQQYPDQEQYGLKKPPPGKAAIASPGNALMPVMKRGLIEPKPAPVYFYDNCAEFDDGSVGEYDVVLTATGYYPVLYQYLNLDFQVHHGAVPASHPCEWEIGPNGIRGWPLRDVSTHPNGRQVLGYPGLYLVGTYYKGKGAMYNFNVEAAIAAEQIADYLQQFD